MAFTTEQTVRAGDTDVTGHVYTPQVVHWIACAVHDLRAAAGYSYARYEAMGIASYAVNVDVDYVAPIRMEDVVSIELTPEMGTTSIRFVAVGTVDGTTVFDGSITIALVDVTTDDSVPIPPDLRRALDRSAEPTR